MHMCTSSFHYAPISIKSTCIYSNAFTAGIVVNVVVAGVVRIILGLEPLGAYVHEIMKNPDHRHASRLTSDVPCFPSSTSTRPKGINHHAGHRRVKASFSC
jgi:hypothetical protein